MLIKSNKCPFESPMVSLEQHVQQVLQVCQVEMISNNGTTDVK